MSSSLLRTRQAQRGLTLIELMVSVLIGFVVVGAVTYMYIGSKGAYRGNESQARIQEAGRFALDAITNDIRRAGGLGCGTLQSVNSGSAIAVNLMPTPTKVTPGGSIDPTTLMADGTVAPPVPIPIQGLTIGPTYPQPPTTAPAGWTPPTGQPAYWGGDILQLQIATGTPVRVIDNPDTSAGTFTIADNTTGGFNQNDYVVLANCSSATVFQTPSAPSSVTPQPPLAPAPATVYFPVGGSVPPLTQPQQLGFGVGTYSTVQHFDQVTYYLGTVPGSANSTSGKSSALYRYSMALSKAEEVADNVEDLDVSYGVPSAAGPVYESAAAVTAASAWSQVISVRISLIAVGDQQGIAIAKQQFAFHGAGTAATPVTWKAPDTRLRQVFTVIATLRDRLQ